MQRFYYLSMRGLKPCSLTKANYIEATVTWLCEGCKCPKPGTEVVNVMLETPPSRQTALNIVFGVGIGIARRELLEDIGWNFVERDLHIGKVFDSHAKELTEFVSFKGRHILIIRGIKNASYRVCPKCGNLSYFAMPESFLVNLPPSEVDIFESNSHQIILSGRAYAGFPHEKWKRSINIKELEVIKTPLDGFGELNIPDRN